MATTKAARSAKQGARADGFVAVATLEQVPEASSVLVEVEGTRVALFNLNGEIYAIEDVCTHDGGPLVEGTIVHGCEVQCPRHGARFDIRTGAAVSFPAFRPTVAYDVRVEGETILVHAPA